MFFPYKVESFYERKSWRLVGKPWLTSAHLSPDQKVYITPQMCASVYPDQDAVL